MHDPNVFTCPQCGSSLELFPDDDLADQLFPLLREARDSYHRLGMWATVPEATWTGIMAAFNSWEHRVDAEAKELVGV